MHLFNSYSCAYMICWDDHLVNKSYMRIVTSEGHVSFFFNVVA